MDVFKSLDSRSNVLFFHCTAETGEPIPTLDRAPKTTTAAELLHYPRGDGAGEEAGNFGSSLMRSVLMHRKVMQPELLHKSEVRCEARNG